MRRCVAVERLGVFRGLVAFQSKPAVAAENSAGPYGGKAYLAGNAPRGLLLLGKL